MFGGDVEDGQSFEDVGIGPCGQPGSGVLVTLDEATEFFVGVVGISGGEDVSHVVSDLFSHFDFVCVLHRVLSQVELAA